jgi:CBS domain-containing protein
MKVQEIMISDVGTCGPESDLAAAATIMWERDCGCVPVLDGERKVLGMITDRDICMAVATRNKRASEIKVAEVASGQVYTCSPEHDLKDIMGIMRNEQLRRLPVVDSSGVLQGIVSINDIVLHAEKGASKKHISHKDAMATLKAVCAHRRNDTVESQQHQPAPAGELDAEG